MASNKGWGIDVLNLQESLDAFSRAEQAFGVTPLKECLMPFAKRIRDRSKQLVNRTNRPKGEGYLHLREAIFAADGREDLPSVIVGVDRKKAPHAHLVEMGHGGPHPAPPHPFLRPAFDAMRSAAEAVVGREINERIIKKLTSGYRKESEALARAARRSWGTKF